MEDEQSPQQPMRVLERHIQSLALVALLSVSAWNAATTHGTALNVAQMNAKLESMKSQELRRDRQIETLDERIRELELRVARTDNE